MTELTKREQIAAMAMQGILADGKTCEIAPAHYSDPYTVIANTAYDFADALLANSEEQGDEQGEFDWSQVKPGSALQTQVGIFWYIGPDIGDTDYVVVSDSVKDLCMGNLQTILKSDIHERAPEYDWWVTK